MQNNKNGLETEPKAVTTISITVTLLKDINKRTKELKFQSRSKCIEHYILLGIKAENRISGGESP